VTLPGFAPAACAMSRIETALNPLVENNSSAAHKIASRMFGLRALTSSLSDCRAISLVRMYKWTGQVNRFASTSAFANCMRGLPV